VVERSAAFAAGAMAASIVAGDPASTWRGAAIDSRRVRGGEIFFALEGERTDGHRFAGAAVDAGAAAVVVHRELEPADGAAWLRVEDSYRALHDLTRAVRAEVPERLVGLTGSVGKTTTKELLAAMLARRYRTARTPGNLNNLYGFPLSLLGVPDDCQWMVAEMGMSTPGELRGVSLLGRPDAALLLNVRPAHLASFDDLRGIAEAKAEILAGLAPGGTVVANADDPEVMGIVERHAGRAGAGRIVRFGFADGTGAEVRGSDLEPLAGRPGCRFRITVGAGTGNADDATESHWIELPIHGLYNAENALAAAACAHALGVGLDQIAAAVADFRPGKMRGEVHRLPSGATVVDDSYNSNPVAAERALESARALPADRYLAVLGDMRELGDGSADFHRRVGRRAAELGFAVVAVGEEARRLAEGAGAAGASVEWYADADAAARWAASALADDRFADGDLVLVKGSRGVGLEAVVRALLAPVATAEGGRG